MLCAILSALVDVDVDTTTPPEIVEIYGVAVRSEKGSVGDSVRVWAYPPRHDRHRRTRLGALKIHLQRRRECLMTSERHE
jgi:hypothetical protein